MIICRSTSLPCGGWSTSVVAPTVDLDLAVVVLAHRSHRLEQRPHLTPLDVGARGVGENPPERLAVIAVHLGRGRLMAMRGRGGIAFIRGLLALVTWLMVPMVVRVRTRRIRTVPDRLRKSTNVAKQARSRDALRLAGLPLAGPAWFSQGLSTIADDARPRGRRQSSSEHARGVRRGRTAGEHTHRFGPAARARRLFALPSRSSRHGLGRGGRGDPRAADVTSRRRRCCRRRCATAARGTRGRAGPRGAPL